MEKLENSQLEENEVFNSQNNVKTSVMDSSTYSTLFHSEKEALQDLNDRFASYVDAVRKLQDPESQSLTVSGLDAINGSFIADHIESIKETYEKEIKTSRELFEQEYAEKMVLNSQLKELQNTNELVAQQLQKEKYNSEKLVEKIEKLTNEINKKECDIKENKLQIENLKASVKKIEQEELNTRNIMEQQKKLIRCEQLKCEKHNSKIDSLKENLSFQTKLHKEELAAAYDQVKILREQYESNKQSDEENFTYEELLELRQELLQELHNAKHNVLGGLTAKLNECEGEIESTKSELNAALASKIELENQYSQLKVQYDSEKSKTASLESRLITVTKDYTAQIASLQHTCETRQKRISEITEKMHSLMYDYEDIIGARLALDTELTAYRKLLDSEEKRLKIDLTPQKRTYVEPKDDEYVFSPMSGGKLKFLSCDTKNGLYIEIINTGKKPAVLANYKIQRKLMTTAVIEEFKIVQKICLPHEEVLKLYVSNQETTKDKLALVIPNISSWICKENTHITLIDAKDQIVAEASINYIPSESVECSPTGKRRSLHLNRMIRSRNDVSSSSLTRRFTSSFDSYSDNKYNPDEKKSSIKPNDRKNCIIC